MQNDRIFGMPHQEIPEFGGSLWSTTNQFLTPDECQSIITWGNDQDIGWAGVYRNDEETDDGPVNDISLEHRRVKSCGIPDIAFPWLYTKLAREALLINKMFYNFDIRGALEDAQFLKYEIFEDAGPGMFNWHRDTSGNGIRNRKISMIVQLSDGGDYDGAKLQFDDNARFIECPEDGQGTLITFASWHSHRITPITRGTRYSLVLWITGPPFR